MYTVDSTCAFAGHDKELETITRGAHGVGSGIYKGVNSFSRGMRSGYRPDDAAAGKGGSGAAR
jgi:hypothetical protein